MVDVPDAIILSLIAWPSVAMEIRLSFSGFLHANDEISSLSLFAPEKGPPYSCVFLSQGEAGVEAAGKSASFQTCAEERMKKILLRIPILFNDISRRDASTLLPAACLTIRRPRCCSVRTRCQQHLKQNHEIVMGKTVCNKGTRDRKTSETGTDTEDCAI